MAGCAVDGPTNRQHARFSWPQEKRGPIRFPERVSGTYIQADETPVDVQMHDGRGQNHQAYLWQYGGPGGGAVFDFRLGRGREGPKQFLGNFEGILQTDGYAAYEKVGGPKLVHAVCWAHSRRKFFEAHKVCAGESVAKGIVILIDQLFGIDAEARAGLRLGSTPCPASAASPVAAGHHQTTDRGGAWAGFAFQQARQRDHVYAGVVAEAHALPGLPGTGAEQQPGGKLDAPGSTWPKELDPRRQPTGRAESGGHSVDRRNLPPP
jgi:hypothetical protein